MSSAIPTSTANNDLLPLAGQPLQGQDPLQGTFEETRALTRFPFHGRAKAVIFPSLESPSGTTLCDAEVVTSDMSCGGVSILNRTQLQPGQQLMLLLNEKARLAEVRWCRQVWEGLFAVGCRFLSEPRDADVDEQLMAIDVVISNEAAWWDAADC
jgi:hypothetical protein